MGASQRHAPPSPSTVHPVTQCHPPGLEVVVGSPPHRGTHQWQYLGGGVQGQSWGAAKGMSPPVPPQQRELAPSGMGVPAHPWVLPGWGCTNYSPPTPHPFAPTCPCPWGGGGGRDTTRWHLSPSHPQDSKVLGGGGCLQVPPLHGCWQDGGGHVQPRGWMGVGWGGL